MAGGRRGLRRAGLVLSALVFAAMPVGAGASGHGALAMLAFAGLILLGNAVMRPGSVQMGALGQLALQAVTASAFAALLVGFGQTLRALAQIDGGVDLIGWLFAGAWALVLARIVWPPRLTERLGETAERAMREVHRRGRAERERGRAPPPDPAQRPGPAPAPEPAPELVPELAPEPAPETATRPAPPTSATGAAEPDAPNGWGEPAPDAALAPLDALPGAARPPAVRRALTEVLAAAPPEAVFAALVRRAEGGAPRDRRALLLHATDLSLGARRQGAREAEAAFEAIVAAAEVEALRAFLAAADALLSAAPEARVDLPPVARLLEIAGQIEAEHEAEAEGLVSLAHRLEDLALDAENGADA